MTLREQGKAPMTDGIIYAEQSGCTASQMAPWLSCRVCCTTAMMAVKYLQYH